jgi:CRISPR/Cas system CSM-associated protein Csm2 small subunit
MSKISSITGQSKVFTIQGIDIELKSNYVNLDDLPNLMAVADMPENATLEEKKERGKIMCDLVFKILKKAIPEANDEELKEFGLRNMKPLIEAIVEISGLKNEPTD